MAIPPNPDVIACNEDGLAKKFWTKFRREYVFAKYSPFALALASGSLKIENFRHYMAQILHFLQAFKRAYVFAEYYGADKKNLLSSKLMVNVSEMHNSIIEEWGWLDLVQNCPPDLTTTKYTDFLLAVASRKDFNEARPFEKIKTSVYTFGAITPHIRLYASLGMEFKALLDDGDAHPYGEWINVFSSEKFQLLALQTEVVLDQLSKSLRGEELDVLEKHYHQAMKLEKEFFYAQALLQPVVAPLTGDHHLMIFCDIDQICSVTHSSAVLARLAVVTASKSDAALSEVNMESWRLFATLCLEEYEQCIKNIKPPRKVEFNYEALHKSLDALSDFRTRSNDRVIMLRLLKDLNLEDIKRVGEEGGLMLQRGCRNFFQEIVKNENLNTYLHILSCCWCGDLIRAAFSSGELHLLNIHANELLFDEGISTGNMVRKVETPIHRIEEFKRILNDWRVDSGRKTVTVYIGCLVDDLLCLVAADIGIVIRSTPSLPRVGSEHGVTFVPLYPGLVKKQRECVDKSCVSWKGRTRTLYMASSWDEIHAFILGWKLCHTEELGFVGGKE